MVNWLVGTSDRFARGRQRERGDQPGQRLGQLRQRPGLCPDVAPGRSAQRTRACSSCGGNRRWPTWRGIRTPLLILQAEADERCPKADNEQLFIALRSLGRTVEYVLYPEEYHVYQAAGRVDRRIDRMTRMLDWFDRHLGRLRPAQRRSSSGRGPASWRAAARWPASTARRSAGRGRRRRLAGPREADQEARVEGVAGAGRVGRAERPGRDVERDRRVRWHRGGGPRRPLPPRLTMTTGPGPAPARRAPPGSANRAGHASSSAVASSTSGATDADERQGGRPAVGQERADRGEVEADRRPGLAGQPDRLAAGRLRAARRGASRAAGGPGRRP